MCVLFALSILSGSQITTTPQMPQWAEHLRLKRPLREGKASLVTPSSMNEGSALPSQGTQNSLRSKFIVGVNTLQLLRFQLC